MTRQNSAEAYAVIHANGLLSASRLAVYDWLYKNGPATRNEIDSALSPGKPNPTHSRRLAEMVRMGVLSRVGDRQCRIKGLHSELFDVTDKLPTKYQRPPSASDQLRETIREIEGILAKPGGLFADPRVDEIKTVLSHKQEAST